MSHFCSSARLLFFSKTHECVFKLVWIFLVSRLLLYCCVYIFYFCPRLISLFPQLTHFFSPASSSSRTYHAHFDESCVWVMSVVCIISLLFSPLPPIPRPTNNNKQQQCRSFTNCNWLEYVCGCAIFFLPPPISHLTHLLARTRFRDWYESVTLDMQCVALREKCSLEMMMERSEWPFRCEWRCERGCLPDLMCIRNDMICLVLGVCVTGMFRNQTSFFQFHRFQSLLELDLVVCKTLL